MMTKKLHIFLMILLCWVCANIDMFAAVIEVPADHPTIQGGIDIAEDGDTVLVADGIYRGKGNVNIDFMGKQIIVKSQNGATATVIDCKSAQNTRGFIFQNKETKSSVLEGFTIKNGIHDLGGGIYCNESSPTIKNCVITGNRSVANQYHNQGGGGIYCYNADAVFMACTITDNRAASSNGGGVYFEGEVIQEGLFLRVTKSQPSLIDCVIIDNIGSGIFCTEYVNPIINGCIVSHNRGRGIVYNWLAGRNEITGCRITNNSGGGVECSEFSFMKITKSLIAGNTARFGAGIVCSPSSYIDVSECVIVRNSAEFSGGGIYVLSKDTESTVSHCTITLNDANVRGGGVYADFLGGTFTFTNSIAWGNITNGTHPEFFTSGGTIKIQKSDIKGGLKDIGRGPDGNRFIYEDNIDKDPLFVNPDRGDYRLSRNSPAKNMGPQTSVLETLSVVPRGKQLTMWADIKRK